jgi:3-hydroxyacyl-CoA dehydrogenase
VTTRTDLIDGIAVIRIDNPPVNAGNAAQRAGLMSAIAEALGADGVRGLVIATAGRHFYAGSDLREFDGELARPTLPDVIAAVEASAVPVVAAIRGLALGGGLELALACDRRVAGTSARLGFPEVGFGILPGAGGTVRAARLLGVPAAVDLVASARQVAAEEARELGLVDEVVPDEDLVDRAVEVLRGLAGRDRARDRPVPPSGAEAVEAALAAIPRRARPNVRLAAETVVRGAGLDVDSALAEERALFDRLRVGAESEDLRYAFFAKQAAAKSLRTGAEARSVHRVGVVGAGTMGAALARAFDACGYAVTVVDTAEAALARVRESAPGVETATEVAALAACDLVVDAVFEDMAVKRSLLDELEPVVAADAVIVSNTSYLDLDEMGSGLADPSRFAGLHFFNPPDRNPLVEVIGASGTSEPTLATLGAIVARLGKTGVRAGLGDGFVANRVYADYRTQAEFLVEEGASPADVDEAMVALGFAIGPFAVADMSGLDIAWARRKRLAATRDPRERYVTIADRLCEAGRLGKKTGAGWYDYPDGVRRGVPSPAVAEIVAAERAGAGVEPVAPDVTTIQRRILGSMLAAALEVVGRGVAQRPSDIDVALVEGFAYPRHRGGPLRTLSRLPEADLIASLAAVHASDPVHFAVLAEAADGRVPAAVRDLLARLGEIAPLRATPTPNDEGDIA